MCFQEARILSDDVHNVRRNNSLVVFATLNFAESEKIFDDGDQEALFGLFIYKGIGMSRGTNKSTENVLIAPEIDPMAQHNVFKFCHDHSVPSTCFASFSVRIFSVSETSRWVRYTKSSRIDL